MRWPINRVTSTPLQVNGLYNGSTRAGTRRWDDRVRLVKPTSAKRSRRRRPAGISARRRERWGSATRVAHSWIKTYGESKGWTRRRPARAAVGRAGAPAGKAAGGARAAAGSVKKSHWDRQRSRGERYAMIQQAQAAGELSVTASWEVLEVSASGYYAARHGRGSRGQRGRRRAESAGRAGLMPAAGPTAVRGWCKRCGSWGSARRASEWHG